MKIKLTTSLSGANGSWSPGDDYECDEDEADSLIAAGFAEPLEKSEAAKPETAAKPKATRAAKATTAEKPAK